MKKNTLVKRLKYHYLVDNSKDKGVYTFSEGCQKVDIITPPKFELAYSEAAVQHIHHYILET